MRRTEAHQGVRMIKFRSILDRYESSELNQFEAAELLGVTERTFHRWRDRYEEAGDAGLLDRRLGRASGKRVPVDRSDEVEASYRTRYSGFTAKHFHEHLVRDHRSPGVTRGRSCSSRRRACWYGPRRGCTPSHAAAAADQPDRTEGRSAEPQHSADANGPAGVSGARDR
jgi:hypothetical protein